MPSGGIATRLPIGVRVPGIIALVLIGVLASSMVVSATGIVDGGGMTNHGPTGPAPTGGQTPSDMPTDHVPPDGGH